MRLDNAELERSGALMLLFASYFVAGRGRDAPFRDLASWKKCCY